MHCGGRNDDHAIRKNSDVLSNTDCRRPLSVWPNIIHDFALEVGEQMVITRWQHFSVLTCKMFSDIYSAASFLIHLSSVVTCKNVRIVCTHKHAQTWTQNLGIWRNDKCAVNYIYTGCHRRNGPNFGRVFLMLDYTDITQNTYTQSWTVTEIMAREKCGHLTFPRTVCLQLFSALTLTEQCSTHLCACTSYAQRDKIVFHYCRYSCAMYSAW